MAGLKTALIYDFDGTLARGNMQEVSFIPSLGMDKAAFWKEAGEFMAHCSTKWAIFLMSLKSLVETGKGAPYPNDVQISNWH